MPPSRLGPLGRLSRGESLIIDRHRRKETQDVAAKRLVISPVLYGCWERDEEESPPIRSVRRLSSHERCLLYRRRACISQDEIAFQLVRCRDIINQMSLGITPFD